VSLSVAQFLSEVAAGERPGYLLPGGFKIVFPPEQIGQIDAIAKLAPDILFSQEEEANMPVDKIFVYLSGPRPR
jgi:hypothetical protein